MTASIESEPTTNDFDPYRMPLVRIVNKPKTPTTSGGVRHGRFTKMFVDGVEVSHAVRSVQVTLDAKDAVRATVELFPTEVEFEGVLAEIGPETRHLLTRLGWTPPAWDSTEPA